MSTALRRGDIIHESISIITVGIVMLHRHFNRHIIDVSLTIDDILIKRRLAAVQIGDKFLDASFIVEYFLEHAILMPLILKHDLKPSGEERHLTETLL